MDRFRKMLYINPYFEIENQIKESIVPTIKLDTGEHF